MYMCTVLQLRFGFVQSHAFNTNSPFMNTLIMDIAKLNVL